MQWTVRPYTPADEAEWDRFVMHESGNGTFLQTRNFLNYHPAGRFTDASLMVYNEHGGLGAVVPAALRLDGATRIFRSHPGSTFGGPVLRSTYNSAAKSIGILQAVEDYIATRYDAADLSIRSYSPAAYLYYRMLCLAAGMGCNALSWGISTEERGKVLNFGLVESKEGYASCHAVNLGFTKTFSKKETNDAT